eukprot:1142707-Pelagomonas_calceolata.AAC.6
MSLALLLILIFHCDKCAPEPAVSRQLKDVWLAEMPEISPKQLEGLRQHAQHEAMEKDSVGLLDVHVKPRQFL